MPIGPGSLAVIAIVALIIFGPKKSASNWGKRWETHFVNSKTLQKD